MDDALRIVTDPEEEDERYIRESISLVWNSFDPDTLSPIAMRTFLERINQSGFLNGSLFNPQELMRFDRVWNQHFPGQTPDYSNLDPSELWFGCLDWIKIFCERRKNDQTNLTLFNDLVVMFGSEPSLAASDAHIDTFQFLLQLCKDNLNTYTKVRDFDELDITSLGRLIGSLYLAFQQKNTIHFDAILHKVLIPLLDMGADPDMLMYRVDTDELFGKTLCQYLLVGMHDEKSWRNKTTQRDLFFAWVMRYSKKPLPKFSASRLLYMIYLTLKQEHHILVSAKTIADIPPYIMARAMDTTLYDFNGDESVVYNPFRLPYAGLLTCVRKMIGFTMKPPNANPRAFDYDWPRENDDIFEQWRCVVEMVDAVNYMCAHGHLMRSLLADMAAGEDDERKRKWAKTDE